MILWRIYTGVHKKNIPLWTVWIINKLYPSQKCSTSEPSFLVLSRPHVPVSPPPEASRVTCFITTLFQNCSIKTICKIIQNPRALETLKDIYVLKLIPLTGPHTRDSNWMVWREKFPISTVQHACDADKGRYGLGGSCCNTSINYGDGGEILWVGYENRGRREKDRLSGVIREGISC